MWHSGPENLKKSRPKKFVKSNRSISWIIFLTKFHFLQFQKWPKINFWTEKMFKTAINAISRKKIYLFDFMSFFAWTFLNFLASYVWGNILTRPDTHSPNVDLDFLENLNFHVLMFLKVYKHVFTRVRLCSSKKIHINITHIALMLIWILLDYRVNSAKNHVFRLPFQKGSTKYFHFHVFVFLQVLCIWIYPNLALFTPKIQIDTQTRGVRW